MQRRTSVRLLSSSLLAVTVMVGGLSSASAAPRTEPSAAAARSVLAGHAPTGAPVKTGQRQALRLPTSHLARSAGAKTDADDDTYLDVDPGCAPAKGKAKPNAYVYSSTKLKLDYVLTGTGGLHKTGSVKVKAHHHASLKLKAVAAGGYELTLAVHGRAGLVADESFDVLPCVIVSTRCHVVTFTNPAGNPAAEIMYRGHKKKQYFDLELAPGTSRTVRADYSKIDYEAYGFDDDDAYALGKDTVKVKQKCSAAPAQPGQNAVQTFGDVGCSQSGAAVAELSWVAQPSVKERRYEIRSESSVVAEGSFKGGKDAEVSLDQGAYTYRSYANGILQPFEEQTFTVLRCATVTAQCRAIRVVNPGSVALDVSADGFDANGELVSSDTTAAPFATTTIPWTEPDAYVYVGAANEDPSSTFYSKALPFDRAEAIEDDGLEVPQDC